MIFTKEKDDFMKSKLKDLNTTVRAGMPEN
jgi:hypothetical protein